MAVALCLLGISGAVAQSTSAQTPAAASGSVSTGAGCVIPPTDANFYPFWSLSQAFSIPSLNSGWQATPCAWSFGNVSPQTIENFGKDAQYGNPDLNWYGGTSISAPMPNPEFSGRCGGTY